MDADFFYLQARYYDPATAQFLTRDPLEPLTRSAYGYGGNDPVNNIDPFGLAPCSCTDPGGGGDGIFDAIKEISGTMSNVLSGAAAVTASAAVAIPITAPVTAPLAGILEGASGVTGTLEAVIECLDGGGLDEACAIDVAGAAIPFVSSRNIDAIASRYGDDVADRLRLLAADLEVTVAGADTARDMKERC